MSAFYDTRQVCLNGHEITTKYNRKPETRADYCPECGAETIVNCPNCNASIRGMHFIMAATFGSPRPRPSADQKKLAKNCYNCGTPYPWADKLNSLSEQAFSVDVVLNQIFTNFHRVACQFRRRHSGRETLDIQDEYDVQDLLHALLCLYFDDIRPEEWCPSDAGSSSRTDFLLKNEQLFIEVKMTRKGLKDKHVGEQLIVDIKRYQAHPDCKKLICFVYDPDGYISNPTGLENDLSRTEGGLPVQVIITPKH